MTPPQVTLKQAPFAIPGLAPAMWADRQYPSGPQRPSSRGSPNSVPVRSSGAGLPAVRPQPSMGWLCIPG